MYSFERDSTAVRSVRCFSPDRKMIAVGGLDNCVTVYDISTETEIKIFKFDSAVMSICFSPDGKTIAVGGYDNYAAVYDISTGIEVHSFQRDTYVRSVCFPLHPE